MPQVQGSPAPPWSDLLPELLGLVFLRLPNRADRAFFTAVCRAWCSVARHCRLPPPSPVPWLVLPDGRAAKFPSGETFKLQLPEGVHHHTSCGEWLILSRHDGSCFMMNHFTRATMPLPSLSSYSYYQEPVQVFGYGRGLEFASGWMQYKGTSEISVLSLVLCSTRLIAAILAVEDLGTIALCRPGATAWSVSAHKGCMLLSNMVFFQGKLYALNDVATLQKIIAIDIVDENDSAELIAIDIVDEHNSDEPRVSRIRRLIEGFYLPHQVGSYYLLHLVESHGTLLLIRRRVSYKRQHGIHVVRSSNFVVCEADFELLLWAEVETVGNSQALFLGERCSRAVNVSPYDVSRDCIFFLDECPPWSLKHTAESCGVYDMKDEKVYSPLPMVSWKSKEVPATWIFSQCDTDKLQTEGEGSQETVEAGVDPLTLVCGGTCSADASTSLSRGAKKG